jgi:hypothetical protein
MIGLATYLLPTVISRIQNVIQKNTNTQECAGWWYLATETGHIFRVKAEVNGDEIRLEGSNIIYKDDMKMIMTGEILDLNHEVVLKRYHPDHPDIQIWRGYFTDDCASIKGTFDHKENEPAYFFGAKQQKS